MSDHTHIEWTDATWNPITGCSVISAGCKHCYAMRLAGTRLRHHPSRAGLTRPTSAGPVWNGKVRLNEDWLDQPLRWKKPRRIFVCAHGDLFHGAVPDEWIDRVFAVMALAPQHTFQVLTKRPERMLKWFLERWQGTPAQTFLGMDIPAGGETGRMSQVEYACEPLLDKFGLADPGKSNLWTAGGRCRAMQWQWPLPNVWIGISIEDQPTADERIPLLLQTPAAVRFVSVEPLLGPIELTGDRGGNDYLGEPPGFIDAVPEPQEEPGIDWIIAGGESGPGARPAHPDWFRSLRDQCQAAAVPFFFKQWGEWLPANQMVDTDHLYIPAPDHDPEATRMCKVDEIVLHNDGARHRIVDPGAFQQGCAPMHMFRVGKRAAGRLLDGRTWDEFPRSAP